MNTSCRDNSAAPNQSWPFPAKDTKERPFLRSPSKKVVAISTQAGIAAFARSWALECAKAEITVNAVVPIALTRMLMSIPALTEHVAAAERGEPIEPRLRRLGLGRAEDVASLAVFLASDQARDITGQCIGIGGDKLSLWSHPEEAHVAYEVGGWSAERIAQVW